MAADTIDRAPTPPEGHLLRAAAAHKMYESVPEALQPADYWLMSSFGTFPDLLLRRSLKIGVPLLQKCPHPFLGIFNLRSRGHHLNRIIVCLMLRQIDLGI